MTLIATIKDKLRLLKSHSGTKEKVGQQSQLEEFIEDQDEQTPLPSLFKNMGPVTAHLIVKRLIDKYIYALYGIEGLENNERYYIARVTIASGKVIKTMLVDKRNGMARTLYFKPVSRALS